MERMSKKRKQGKRAARAAYDAKPFAFCDHYDLAVVGGGAAGLACALSCAQEARRLGISCPRIIVLEKGKRIGASILRSGNGRCNFSNSQLRVGEYRNSDFVAQSLSALAEKAEDLALLGPGNMGAAGFPCSDGLLAAPVVSWFEQLGLVWEEAPGTDGLLYPFSNKASSVLEVLVTALQEFDVDLRVCVAVDAVARTSGDFGLFLSQVLPPQRTQAKASSSSAVGQGSDVYRKAAVPVSPCGQHARIQAARVAFAPGGAFDVGLLKSAGLDAFEPWRPVLGPLSVRFPHGIDAGQLDGIRTRARVSVPNAGFSEVGEVLFREYGLSGIVVFNASRAAHEGARLCLDLLPGLSEQEAVALLAQRARQFTGKENKSLFRGFLLPELAGAVCAAAGVSPTGAASEGSARLLAGALKCFPCTVGGFGDERQCQVHRGGMPVGAVRPATMECVSLPGLYALGEALDVDGPCGGYNLHWAWSSGLLAGFDLARVFAEGKRC